MRRSLGDSRLVSLATSKRAQRVAGLADFLASLRTDALLTAYTEVKFAAPARGRDGKRFFFDRTDHPIRRETPKPTEDLLEMALKNADAQLQTPYGDVTVLMRQFPLFSSGSRKWIRAVDLVGHGQNRFWVIELKAQPADRYGESPARALLEALIYSAVVEANNADIANELRLEFGLEHAFSRPGIMIAAPSPYWSKWESNAATGDWWTQYERLTREMAEALETPIAVTDLGDIVPIIDATGRPHLNRRISGCPVSY